MINKVLVEDKSELRAINRKCTKITTKLSLQYNDKLEYCNLMLGKRVMTLDKINKEYYRYISELNQEIGELTQEILHLEMKLPKNESMKWRILQSNEIMDRRQKMFDKVEIMSDSSLDSYGYSEMLEIDDC